METTGDQEPSGLHSLGLCFETGALSRLLLHKVCAKCVWERRLPAGHSSTRTKRQHTVWFTFREIWIFNLQLQARSAPPSPPEEIKTAVFNQTFEAQWEMRATGDERRERADMTGRTDSDWDQRDEECQTHEDVMLQSCDYLNFSNYLQILNNRCTDPGWCGVKWRPGTRLNLKEAMCTLSVAASLIDLHVVFSGMVTVAAATGQTWYWDWILRELQDRPASAPCCVTGVCMSWQSGFTCVCVLFSPNFFSIMVSILYRITFWGVMLISGHVIIRSTGTENWWFCSGLVSRLGLGLDLVSG